MRLAYTPKVTEQGEGAMGQKPSPLREKVGARVTLAAFRTNDVFQSQVQIL